MVVAASTLSASLASDELCSAEAALSVLSIRHGVCIVWQISVQLSSTEVGISGKPTALLWTTLSTL